MTTMEKPARACGISRRAVLGFFLCVPSLAFLATARAAADGEIKRQPLQSSVLESAGSDAKARALEIAFHSGAIYRYLEVPGEIFRRLLAAESKGRFFSTAIRDKFRSERVKPRNAK
jgi:hypothetical protein